MARQPNISAEAVYQEAEKLLGKRGKPMRLSVLTKKVNQTLHSLDPSTWDGEMSERDLVRRSPMNIFLPKLVQALPCQI